MEIVDRYYNKLYKETGKVTKKLFGLSVNGSMAEKFRLKKYFEKHFEKPVEEITSEDIMKKQSSFRKQGRLEFISYSWAKYKTLSKILEVLESACFLKNFTIEEYEDEC